MPSLSLPSHGGGDNGEENPEGNGTHGSDEMNDGSGDEAHGVLKRRPELSRLTWEQDLVARQGVKGTFPGYDFLAAAPVIAVKAVLMGTIECPGAWLAKQYLGLAEQFGGFEKKEKTAGATIYKGPTMEDALREVEEEEKRIREGKPATRGRGYHGG
jgi:hypothetical protein